MGCSSSVLGEEVIAAPDDCDCRYLWCCEEGCYPVVCKVSARVEGCDEHSDRFVDIFGLIGADLGNDVGEVAAVDGFLDVQD